MKTIKNYVKESFKINKNTKIKKVSTIDLTDWIEYIVDEMLKIFDTSGDDWPLDGFARDHGTFEEALKNCGSFSDLLDWFGAFDTSNIYFDWENFYDYLSEENDLKSLGIKDHDDLIDFFAEHDVEITKYILSQL